MRAHDVCAARDAASSSSHSTSQLHSPYAPKTALSHAHAREGADTVLYNKTQTGKPTASSVVGSSSASQRDTSAPCLEYKSHNVAWLASLLREQSHAMDPTVNACVVWLHGDGETGHTWYLRFKSGVDRIRMPWIEFACPEADRRNWFGVDLPVINDSAVDGAELDAAIAHVHSELDAIQYKGIAASRIMLGGYGPGAALALLAGRTYGHDLAGIACMGGWLLRPNHPSSSARSPILLGHGEEDDDVPFELYRFACSWLTAEGYDLECQQYTGLGHRETAEAPTALAAPKNFITNRLPPILDAATLAERERAAGRGRPSGSEHCWAPSITPPSAPSSILPRRRRLRAVTMTREIAPPPSPSAATYCCAA